MKENLRRSERGPNEEPGRDDRLGEALRALDPGSTDGGYWLRFHRSVMDSARNELARRRMMADLTVSDLMTSWSRTLVPAAMLAAAVAALFLLQPRTSFDATTSAAVALEEMVGEEFGQDVFRPNRESTMDVTFASEGF